MSLPRYPEYKDSGAQWIGEVPAHWSALKVKAFTEFCGGGTPSRDNLAYWNGDIPWVSPKDMKSERITRAEECITSEGLLNSSSSMVDAGRLLMVVRSGILKHTIPVAINDVPVALNQDMKALRFSEQLATSDFFLRWVQGLNDALLLAWGKQGATVESVEHAYLAETLVPLPTLAEQHAIATFLDRETAKIDALIAEQETLLALLAEKRQATISHAVTRGLNPNAPMKDSGIPWLGEVPAYWEVGPLKRFWSVTDCKHLTAEFIEDGIPLASIREVQSRFVDLSDAKRTTESFFEQLIEGGRDPRAGDLLFSRNATVGEVAQVPGSVERFAMGQDVCLLRRLDGVASPDYMQRVLRSPVVFEQLNALMIGSTFKRINVEQIRSLAVPFPPVGEQLEISSYLEELLGSYESLAQEAFAAVALLKERRSALISVAVTGKIDVRQK